MKELQITILKSQLTRQRALVAQYAENTAVLKAYANHDKFNDGHGINRNDVLLRISEGAYELQRIHDDYCY